MPLPLLLAGPTAVGKSEVALLLAERLGAEIISVDSMPVYRGLDIGTAKPGPEERRRIPHHLLDVADLSESFDAARFVSLAQAARADIEARGRRAIFCGGTGLYFKAWLEGLGEAPPADPAIRAALEQMPLPDLLAELAACDPVTFERIDRQNPRRVIRALEVIRVSGRPFSEQRAAWSGVAAPPGGAPLIALGRSPEDLRARIDTRVDRMFARGLVEETRGLLEQGLAAHRTALQAIGYRQVTEHLQGRLSLAETCALVKQKTWQYARRQRTWLRHQLSATWVEVTPAEEAAVTADRLARLWDVTGAATRA